MSLDVYLKMPIESNHEESRIDFDVIRCCHKHEPSENDPGGSCVYCKRCRTWIRPHKWDGVCVVDGAVYDSNITHNLNRMADAAGIYKELWRPEEIGITHAKQLIKPLTEGLMLLQSDQTRFEQFNASNGWGLYEHFVPWVSEYLEACKQYPDAKVEASR